MDKYIKDQLKDIPALKLSEQEKSVMHSDLLKFMDTMEDAKLEKTNWMPSLFVKPLFAVLVLVVGAGSGVGLAAQSALPGDILYPVKIHVTEKVQTWFASSNDAEGQFLIDLSQKRLDEAAKLAENNKLSTEVEVNLRENFKGKLNDGLNKVDKSENFLLELDDNLQIRINNLTQIREKTDNPESKRVLEDLINEVKLNVITSKPDTKVPGVINVNTKFQETRKPDVVKPTSTRQAEINADTKEEDKEVDQEINQEADIHIEVPPIIEVDLPIIPVDPVLLPLPKL